MRRQTRYILALALTIGALLLPGLARVVPLLAASVPSTATFVRADTTTQGTWQGVYGADGYNIINDTTNYPSYVTVSASGTPYTWNPSTTDVSALQKAAPGATDRIAATWFSGNSFTIDINVTDGQTHRVAIYCLDWSGGRKQTVQVFDGDSPGAALDAPRPLSNFVSYTSGGPGAPGGTYLVWNISGHVKIQVTNVNPSPNAVVSGLFFDPAQPIYSSPQADPTNNNALICPSPDQSVAQGVSVPGAYAYGQTVAENNPFDPIHAPSSSACQPGGVAATGNLDWGSQPITNTPPTAPWISSDQAYQTYNLCYKNCGQPNYRPYNGRWVTIYTKIPDDYTTTYNPVDAGGHPLNPNPGWWYVQYNTTSHQSFTDRTTWEMTILTRGPHLVQ